MLLWLCLACPGLAVADPGTTPDKLASRANLFYQKARFLLLDGYRGPALAALDMAFALAPNDLRVAGLKARVLADLGKPEKALAFCRGLLREDPVHFGELNFQIAYVHLGQTDYPMAFQALEAASQTHPARAWREIGQLWSRLNHPREAARAYGKALKVDRDNRAELMLLLARAKYDDLDYLAARALLRQVHGDRPGSFIGKGAEALAKQVDLADRPWWLGLSLGGLWDSNVYVDPLVADPARAVVTGQADFAWQAGAWGGVRLVRSGRFNAGLSLYASRTDYLERTSGSYAYLAPGLYAGWGRGDWGWRVSYVYYHYTNSGEQDDYAQMHYLMPTLYWWAHPRLVNYFTLALAERDYYNNAFSGALYGSLAGDHRWFFSHQRKTYLKLTWQLEREDAYDKVSGYDGYLAGVGVGGKSGAFGFSLTAYFIHYDYDRRQEFTLDYAWFKRRDDQYKLALSAWCALGKWWTLTLSAYALHNDSNVASGSNNPYDYDKNQISLTLSKSF